MNADKPAKIILDIDNALSIPVQDTDDAIALALALVSPELELIGCTTCAGNCRTWQSTINTLRLLERADAGNIPVAGGREEAFLRDREPHFRYLEEKTGSSENKHWKGLLPPAEPKPHPSALKAHEFIAHAVRRHPGEITLVCLGSFTNLALALLADPDLAGHIKAVVHMGGVLQKDLDPQYAWLTPDIPDAIWQTTLRFNTAFDPEASAIVFRSEIPTILVTANVTTRVFQYRRDMLRLNQIKSRMHRYLYRWGAPWVEWSMAERGLPGAHMHDPLTLGVLIDPGFCRFETMAVNVDRLLAGRSDWLAGGTGGNPVQAAVAVDASRFESFLSHRLTTAVLEKYRYNGAF